MRIIAVDDEQYALLDLQSAIEEALPGNELVCFSTSGQAFAYAKENQVDMAFLDIEMGGMDGIELAEKLTGIYDKTNIIFITGYQQYAMDSYRVNASDFLKKPVTKEKIMKSQERLRNPVKVKRVRVKTFGGFEVFVDDKPLYFPRKMSKKIFAYLVYKQGVSSTVKEIAAALMGDKRGGNLQIQADISVMMKVFGGAGAKDVIVKEYNSLAVDTLKIDCDYYRFLENDEEAKRLWMGEFMSGYEWAEHIAGYLDRLTK